MKNDIDLKTLWNKGGSNEVPDVKELLKKAGNIRKAARVKLIIQSLVLLVAIGIIWIVGLNINNKQLTVTIGSWLMILAMIIYLVASNQLLPMLFKSDIEMSSKEFLSHLIRIKRNNEFMDKVMVHIYFGVLFAGLFLYLLPLILHISILKAVLCSVTFICLGLAWYYSKTREFKKLQNSLNNTINSLEAVSKQLNDTD